MPELPEVETSKQGIKPYLVNQRVQEIVVRKPKLRVLIPETLSQLKNQRITTIERRGKYLLINAESGSVILHRGMSGSLRVQQAHTPPGKHDHVDFIIDNGYQLRFTDPRRFGVILWTEENPYSHPLLASLGVEPLTQSFNKDYLFQKTRSIKKATKLAIMDNKIVVGIGNIYATEALYLAKINPSRPANQLKVGECDLLVTAIKSILKKAIKLGGTTLKDFFTTEGKPGYFKQELKAYGRQHQPCLNCSNRLVSLSLGQRTTVYCATCQT